MALRSAVEEREGAPLEEVRCERGDSNERGRGPGVRGGGSDGGAAAAAVEEEAERLRAAVEEKLWVARLGTADLMPSPSSPTSRGSVRHGGERGSAPLGEGKESKVAEGKDGVGGGGGGGWRCEEEKRREDNAAVYSPLRYLSREEQSL